VAILDCFTSQALPRSVISAGVSLAILPPLRS
jgi:hypothetical protein